MMRRSSPRWRRATGRAGDGLPTVRRPAAQLRPVHRRRPRSAGDVVQDTFLLAQERVRQLRDPSRLGPWLYAIARNESLRRISGRKHTVPLADADEPVLDTDPGRALHAAQVREVVHAAADGLNDGDREVFELTVRHGLSAAEVAAVLDVSAKHAHARMLWARTQFEGALGALLLARDGGARCESLAGLVRGWDGRLTALLRKRIERHAHDCAVCARCAPGPDEPGQSARRLQRAAVRGGGSTADAAGPGAGSGHGARSCARGPERPRPPAPPGRDGGAPPPSPSRSPWSRSSSRSPLESNWRGPGRWPPSRQPSHHRRRRPRSRRRHRVRN